MAACWLQADMPDKAREALVALRQRHPTLRVKVAGRETPIFSDDAEARRLAGEADRDAADGRGDRGGSLVDVPRRRLLAMRRWLGSAPLLNMRWRVLSTDDPR